MAELVIKKTPKNRYTEEYTGNFGDITGGRGNYKAVTINVPSGYQTTGIASITKAQLIGAPNLVVGASITKGQTGSYTGYVYCYSPTSYTSSNTGYVLYVEFEEI